MKSKNLTIILKPGNIKSVSNPVYCQIGGVVRKVKLSKNFKNAGTILSVHYYTDQGIVGSYNDKTKVDSQWMFRRVNGVLQSAKLGKWKEDKKANDAFYLRPKK